MQTSSHTVLSCFVFPVNVGGQCRQGTAVSPGTESLVIIKSWWGYLDYFEDYRYVVHSIQQDTFQ